MQTLEDVFKKEFKNAVGIVGQKDIYSVPLPESVNQWSVSNGELYAVKGIKEDYFNLLNKTIVQRIPKGMIAKRRVIDKVNRNFKVDEDGNFVYEDYKVPAGSIVVVSDTKIGLPYKEYINPPEGYGYIDFNEKDGKIKYLYVLPKTVLYKVNQTALALSVRNMKNYYGMGYVTWNMGTIYLHIIPYKPNSQYIGSKILATKYSLDFSEEINQILTFWQLMGVIPELSLCKLSDETNLALKPIAVGYDEYSPVDDLAIGDREIYGSESNIEGENAE